MRGGIAPQPLPSEARANDAAFHVNRDRERTLRSAGSHRLNKSGRRSRAASAGSLRAASAGSMRSALSSASAFSINSRPSSGDLLRAYNTELLKPQTPWPSRDSIDPGVLVHGFSKKVSAERGRVVASARLFASRLWKELKLMGLKEADRKIFFRSMLAEVGMDAVLATAAQPEPDKQPAATEEPPADSAPPPPPLSSFGVQDSNAALEDKVSQTIARYDTNGDGIFEPAELRTIVRDLLVQGQEDAAIRDEYELTKMRLSVVEAEAEELADKAEWSEIRVAEAETVMAKAKRREAGAKREAQASRAAARNAHHALSAAHSSDGSLAWARAQREGKLKDEVGRARSFAAEMERTTRRAQRRQARAAELAATEQARREDTRREAGFQIVDLRRALSRAEEQIAELQGQLEQSKTDGMGTDQSRREAEQWIEVNARHASDARAVHEKLTSQAVEMEEVFGAQVLEQRERAEKAEGLIDESARNEKSATKRAEVAEYHRATAERMLAKSEVAAKRELEAVEKRSRREEMEAQRRLEQLSETIREKDKALATLAAEAKSAVARASTEEAALEQHRLEAEQERQQRAATSGPAAADAGDPASADAVEEGEEPERPEAAGTDEASEQLRAIFRRADRNSDGSLSRAELIIRLRKDAELAALLNLPQQIVDGDREAFEVIFKDMDTDEDRGIGEEEFVAYFAAQASPAAEPEAPPTQLEQPEEQDVAGEEGTQEEAAESAPASSEEESAAPRTEWSFTASSAASANSMWISGVAPESSLPMEGAKVRVVRNGRAVGVRWTFTSDRDKEPGVALLCAVAKVGRDGRAHGLSSEECDCDDAGQLLLAEDEEEEG